MQSASGMAPWAPDAGALDEGMSGGDLVDEEVDAPDGSPFADALLPSASAGRQDTRHTEAPSQAGASQAGASGSAKRAASIPRRDKSLSALSHELIARYGSDGTVIDLDEVQVCTHAQAR